MICLAVGRLLGSGSVQLAISESISLGHSSGTLLQHMCVSGLPCSHDGICEAQPPGAMFTCRGGACYRHV